ncbi:uncharacterized protein LOC142362052 [Opisthocomus hoazin]|uniref:uncharacterized protein LOC142362052 n=1 Tax=Opisthocomus hoazin TaxID=30419 RepID=UPI003F5310C7
MRGPPCQGLAAATRWGTAKRPELRKRSGGEQEREASEAAESPGSAESESCGGGQPRDRSYGRGVEESRREKRLKRQSLPAAPRARAAVSAGPSGPRRPSSASRLSPGSRSFPHCCDFCSFFFSLPPPTPSLLPCTCFLHLCLTSSLSPSFRSSLSALLPVAIFVFSVSLGLAQGPDFFKFLPLCPVACHFCRSVSPPSPCAAPSPSFALPPSGACGPLLSPPLISLSLSPRPCFFTPPVSALEPVRSSFILWLSLSSSQALFFNFVLLGPVPWCDFISFAVSPGPAPCQDFLIPPSLSCSPLLFSLSLCPSVRLPVFTYYFC